MAQCEATAKSTGERCKKDAIPGTNVCHVHGGNAPQVQAKAQERLDRMADRTTADLEDQIRDLHDEYDHADDPEAKLAIMAELRRVWKIILDRTGHGPTEKRDVDVDGELSGEIDLTVKREVVDADGND